MGFVCFRFVSTVVWVYANGPIRQAGVRRWLNELGQRVSYEYISIIQIYRDTGLEEHHLTEISEGFQCVWITVSYFAHKHTGWHGSNKMWQFFCYERPWSSTIEYHASNAKRMSTLTAIHLWSIQKPSALKKKKKIHIVHFDEIIE